MSLPLRECHPLVRPFLNITPAASAVSPDRILLTASTSEAYAFVFKLLADPGDEVLVPSPSYPLFDYLAALDSVRVVQYPLVYHGTWTIDFDALASSITSAIARYRAGESQQPHRIVPQAV